jgi:cytochrome c553
MSFTMMTRRMLLAAATAAMFCVSPAASSADLGAGKAKATEVCAACHGADGNSASPDFPKLGGQHPDYLAKALRDYKSGQRKNPIMAGFAQALSKQDIENLAAYYGSQPATVSVRH